jgi:glycosyltransferase involved in cell wall biosynthesis
MPSATEKKRFSNISFFCPAYNEEKNLPVLIPKAHALLSSLTDTFEILIIENGSRDSTAAVADELAQKFPGVKALHYKKGLGYGGALIEGFKRARYDYVCYTDGDNQYNVDELKAGFDLMEHADVASGYVRAKAVSPYRKVQSSLFNALVVFFFFAHIRDINCSLKIYKREVLNAIEIKSRSAFIDAEMLLRAYRKGFIIAQFPVTHYERTSGNAIGSNPSVIWGTFVDMLKFRLGFLG